MGSGMLSHERMVTGLLVGFVARSAGPHGCTAVGEQAASEWWWQSGRIASAHTWVHLKRPRRFPLTRSSAMQGTSKRLENCPIRTRLGHRRLLFLGPQAAAQLSVD